METGKICHISVFNILWSVAHIGHTLRKESAQEPLVWLLLLACVLLIEKPFSLIRLGFLALSQVALFVAHLPLTDNHMYIMAFVNAGILVVVVPAYYKKQTWTHRTFASLKSYAVITLLISYSAAAFAKLNYGFFNPSASCAVTMFYDATSLIGIKAGSLPSALETLLPFLIAGTEVAISLLLAIRPTRRFGIVVVVLFHLSISISPTATALDFTLLLFALVYLLLPISSSAYLKSIYDLLAKHKLFNRLNRTASIPVLFLFFVLAAIVWEVGTVAGNGGWMLLSVTALIIGPLLIFLAVRTASQGLWPSVVLSAIKPLQYILIGMLIFNVVTPYMGIKTVGTFTMYSNLNTFDSQSNHFFIPRLPVSSFHDDLIQIISSSNKKLEHIQRSDFRITWHELQRELARDPEASISYIRAGRRYTYNWANQNPDLVTLHPILHKLVAHRAYDGQNRYCLW